MARTVVDVHAHAMPMSLLRWLEGEGLADLSRVEDHIVVIDPRVSGVGAGAPLPLPDSMFDNAVRLAEMAADAVSHQAISLPPFLMGSTCTDTDLVLELVRRGNDALAELVADEESLIGLVGVPVGHPGAEAELRRGLDELGLAGAAIGSRGAGKDLDDPVNAPVWSLLAEREVFTFLHPSAMPDPPRMKDFWFPQLVGYPMETAIATARLTFSGVLEANRFPLCLAHGGGCLPSLRGRLDMGWDRKPVAHTTEVPPSEIFDRLYYDTAVFSPVLLQRLIEDVGAEHVLVGTDYPFDLREKHPVAAVDTLGLSSEQNRAVLGEVAARLLRIS
ncbi:amidohydrolase [Naumannella sp. ID2617S]|nr:amidohydrolase [Naumannella sp. ID2617S]